MNRVIVRKTNRLVKVKILPNQHYLSSMLMGLLQVDYLNIKQNQEDSIFIKGPVLTVKISNEEDNSQGSVTSIVTIFID